MDELKPAGIADLERLAQVTRSPDPAVVELVRAARAAKVFIGARNESLRAYVVEANINQAWHILETALTPFSNIKDAE